MLESLEQKEQIDMGEGKHIDVWCKSECVKPVDSMEES